MCSAVWLTLQCHSAIFREFIRIKEYGGRSVQGVLHMQHILVLETFIVKVEIPGHKNRKQGNNKHSFFFFF